MEKSELFNCSVKVPKKSTLSIRLPSDIRNRLDFIARERSWQISEMVNKMIRNYIVEYEKLPKGKQSKFDFI